MHFQAARPSEDDPALLYSLAELGDVIFAAFEAAGVRRVVEIGAETGDFTERLVPWAEGRGGSIVSIDPVPGDKVRDLAASSPASTLLEMTSLEALAGLEAADAYLIDGDHNYFTVAGELEAISAATSAADHDTMIVIQDIGWPSGQRDQYYNPATLPEGAVHPYDFGGVVPWSPATGPGGFRGEGWFAFATEEGGARNGVRTALEDFLAQRGGWDVISVPCIFGLGVVFPVTASWAPALRQAIGWLDDHPLLARLESNRLLLYIRLLEAQDALARQRQSAAERVADLEASLDAARSELAITQQILRGADALPD